MNEKKKPNLNCTENNSLKTALEEGTPFPSFSDYFNSPTCHYRKFTSVSDYKSTGLNLYFRIPQKKAM